MKNINTYAMTVPFENSYELLLNFLILYSSVQNIRNGKNYLRPKLIEILAYYMLKGYNSDTKEYIIKHEPSLNKANLNQINSELSRKNLLIRDKYKAHDRVLSKDLQALSDYVLGKTETRPIFTIVFKKVD